MTCNQCGSAVPDGVMNCQRCGKPLKADNGFGPRMGGGGQEQPGLPAWLESLRVGERPSAPANAASKFSTADLIDEGVLPNWMRSERPGSSGMTGPNPPVAAPPPSSPTPSNKESVQPKGMNGGLNAQSLVDERSLPSWMQEGKQSAGPVSQGDKNIAASSLIQPEYVPDWMKTLQQQSPTSNAPSPAPRIPPVQPMPSAQPSQPMKWVEPMSSPAQGISPRDLIDETALPSWMAPQNVQGQAAFPPANGRPASAGQLGQPSQLEPSKGLSGSSLLDMNALPSWLQAQAGGQMQGSSNNMVPPPAQAPSWQSQQPPMQAPATNAAGVPAASFIDVNALPEWLRSAAGPDAPAMQSMPGSPRPGSYAVPSRIENVRVPSRPRSEMNPNESSEVAANVFASMLGVASSAPQFPSAPASSPYAQQNLMQQGMPPIPEPISGISPRPSVGGPQGYGSAGMGYGGGYQGGSQGQGNQSGYPAGGFPGAGLQGLQGPQYPTSMSGISSMSSMSSMPPSSPMMSMPPSPGVPGMAEAQRANKPKRGLVEALRDWLSR